MKQPPIDQRFAQPADIDRALAEAAAGIERERIEGAGAAIADLEALAQGRKRLLRPIEPLIPRPNGRT